MKEDYQKPLKSQLYFFFRTQSFLMDNVIKNKRDLELVPSCSSGHETSSKNPFISYTLSDQVWWCHIKRLLSYFKNCLCKFMQASSWHRKLFHFHLSFCIWKVRKGREKITKVWISQEWKELFWWNKKHFIILEGLIIWWKNFIKNSGHKL